MITHKEAAEKYPYLFQLSDDNILEIYADNHILSHIRLCESYFVENFVNNIGGKGRSWYLEFGIWTHKWVEHFYKNYSTIKCHELVDFGSSNWLQMKIDEFKEFSSYKKLGGLQGAVGLIVQYWNMYAEGRDPIKIIDCELSFGRKKEVPILENPLPEYHIPFRAYYCGRMDMVGDDGVSIFPIDTKTTSKINDKTSSNFEPHEGIEGYVYALNKIFQRYFASLQRSCNKAVINHIQVEYCSNYMDRFKRTPISFSPAKLEEWRSRQIRTFKKLYELIILEETPDWNTQYCTNLYNSECPYRQLHRNDPINREALLQANFVKIEPWRHEIDSLRKEGELYT